MVRPLRRRLPLRIRPLRRCPSLRARLLQRCPSLRVRPPGAACRFAFGRSGVVRRFELGRSSAACRQPCLSSAARHLAISPSSAARCPAPVSQLLPVALRFSIVRRRFLERGGRLFVGNFPVEANFLRLAPSYFLDLVKHRLGFDLFGFERVFRPPSAAYPQKTGLTRCFADTVSRFLRMRRRFRFIPLALQARRRLRLLRLRPRPFSLRRLRRCLCSVGFTDAAPCRILQPCRFHRGLFPKRKEPTRRSAP